MQKALKIVGYSTHAAQRNGKVYVMPGELQQDEAAENKPRARERGEER